MPFTQTAAYPDSAKFDVFPISLEMSMFSESSTAGQSRCHGKWEDLTLRFRLSVRVARGFNFALVGRQTIV